MSPRYLVVDPGGVLFPFDHAHRPQRLADVFALPADRIDVLLWRRRTCCFPEPHPPA
ncbi:hypothetical protein [Streptomyces sp. NPDC005930]|uniref:hypothetical protein n=1 Tax=Streptomyces sp. NPDC005930 TaxID=3364736 RepID=UPI0036CDAEE2